MLIFGQEDLTLYRIHLTEDEQPTDPAPRRTVNDVTEVMRFSWLGVLLVGGMGVQMPGKEAGRPDADVIPCSQATTALRS